MTWYLSTLVIMMIRLILHFLQDKRGGTHGIQQELRVTLKRLVEISKRINATHCVPVLLLLLLLLLPRITGVHHAIDVATASPSSIHATTHTTHVTHTAHTTLHGVIHHWGWGGS